MFERVSHNTWIRCSTFIVLLLNVGDETVQRTYKDPDGFVNSKEEAGVKGKRR